MSRFIETTGEFAVSSSNETESPAQWAFVSTAGQVRPGPMAFLWFNAVGGHYTFAIEGEGCLLINGSNLVVEAVTGGEVFRIEGGDSERLTPTAISPDGTEVVFESRAFEENSDCAWVDKRPDHSSPPLTGHAGPWTTCVRSSTAGVCYHRSRRIASTSATRSVTAVTTSASAAMERSSTATSHKSRPSSA